MLLHWKAGALLLALCAHPSCSSGHLQMCLQLSLCYLSGTVKVAPAGLHRLMSVHLQGLQQRTESRAREFEVDWIYAEVAEGASGVVFLARCEL